MQNVQPHLDWIDTQAEHLTQLTEQWSRINSGSFHPEGLAQMCGALEEAFAVFPGEVKRIDLSPLEVVSPKGEIEHIPIGQALRIRVRPEAKRQVFLGGHMDTVFGKDHPFQQPQYLDSNTLNGPGVADMKGGLIVMLTALKALEQSPLRDHIGYEIIINPDEEIGSQSSDFLFNSVAKRVRLGLIYEPALSDGTLAGARKGSGNFTCVVRGKAAHAGREFERGQNAIISAAKLSVALDALNGQYKSVTLNVGKVEGGGPLNMVPDLAIVRFNVRVPDQTARAWVEKEIDRVITQHEADQSQNREAVFIHGGFTRAPKPMSDANEALFRFALQTGQQLGHSIKWKATGGCCDGNNLYAYGVPNIDTLGVRGGNIHSDQEYVLLDSLTERAKLSSLLLTRIANGELDDVI